MDSKAYARDQLVKWTNRQWSCLAKLWGKESAWNPRAYNKVKMFSNWITEAESEWLLDLFTSPVVYAYDGTLVAVALKAIQQLAAQAAQALSLFGTRYKGEI